GKRRPASASTVRRSRSTRFERMTNTSLGAPRPMVTYLFRLAPASLKNILIVLTALLLEQRAAYVREQSSRSGWLLSLLFCSADEELSRASRVLASVKDDGGETYSPLVRHAEA